MAWLILTIVLIIIILELFISRRLSPIPYFPSNKTDQELIIKALGLKNNQTIIDLGAGDGWVIFAAADVAYHTDLNTRFIATDINPILLLIMQWRRLLHPNRSNITIAYHDMFKRRLKDLVPRSQNIALYLYISPWYLEQVAQSARQDFPHLKIVSYYYPIPSLRAKQKHLHGKHAVYIY